MIKQNTRIYGLLVLVITLMGTAQDLFAADVPAGKEIRMQQTHSVSSHQNCYYIRNAKTRTEGIDAAGKSEGAWRYYDNVPEKGKKYGPLHIWFA
jgi:hypothetical protein